MLKVNNLCGFGEIVTSLLKTTLVATFANTDVTSNTVTVPSGAQVGDIAIIFDGAANASGSGITVPSPPSGWTRISTWDYNPGTNSYGGQVLYKVLASGDLNQSYNLTTTGHCVAKFCFVYRVSRPIISVAATVILNLASESSATRQPGSVQTFTTSSVDGVSEISLMIAGYCARNTLYTGEPWTIATPPIVTITGDLSVAASWWAYRCLVAGQDGTIPQQNSSWTNANYNKPIMQMSFLTITA